MVRIKICGITRADQAAAVIAAGADLLGVVLAPSRRQVTPQTATEVVKAAAGHIQVVGVFVNAAADEVNTIAAVCGLSYVQLSGDESWEYCRCIDRPLIKAVRVSPEWTPGRLAAYLEEGERELGQGRTVYLIDTLSGTGYGGTGCTFDHRIVAVAAARFPLLIAGGLNPDNVGPVVRGLKPWGVDVSSGVETDGEKSAAKIEAFIRVARAAAA